MEKTLVDHTGTLSAAGGWCGEHATDRSVSTPASRLAHDVWPSGAPDPRAWRRCQKRDAGAASAFTDPTPWCIELRDTASARGLPGDCPWDRSCTRATVLNPIESRQRADVGDRKR